MTNSQIKQSWVADFLKVDPRTEEGQEKVFQWLFKNVLLTFPQWKEIGYYVKKGEHAFAKINTWHPRKTNKKVKDEEADGDEFTGDFFMKVDFYFTASQVAKMEVGKNE